MGNVQAKTVSSWLKHIYHNCLQGSISFILSLALLSLGVAKVAYAETKEFSQIATPTASSRTSALSPSAAVQLEESLESNQETPEDLAPKTSEDTKIANSPAVVDPHYEQEVEERLIKRSGQPIKVKSLIGQKSDLTGEIITPIDNPIMCVDRQCLEVELDNDQLEALRLLALSGDSRAQNAMGLLSLQGKRMRPSPYQAGIYFIQAAMQGNAHAQNNLGMLYYQGHGVDQNYSIAFQWLILSANNGWHRAQYNLGKMYLNGHGVFKDNAMGMMWMEKAAEQGYDVAQFRIANAYLNGVGVKKDKETAIKWFERACMQNYNQACGTLEKLTLSFNFAGFK